jgi:hypothetical protein
VIGIQNDMVREGRNQKLSGHNLVFSTKSMAFGSPGAAMDAGVSVHAIYPLFLRLSPCSCFTKNVAGQNCTPPFSPLCGIIPFRRQKSAKLSCGFVSVASKM